MLKSTFILVLGLLLFQNAKAQKDTSIYFVKNTGEIVNRDSADYVVFIMPPDNSSGEKLYPINEYYMNGKRRLMGMSSFPVVRWLKFEGPCITYYPNGNRKSAINYKNGLVTGNMAIYYPNGMLYAVEKYDETGRLVVLSCRDSTGKMLAENGNGMCINFDENFTHLTAKGALKNGVKDGEWFEMINDSTTYISTYQDGLPVNTKPPVMQINGKQATSPTFQGGITEFYKFFGRHFIYPAIDVENKISGKVVISFIVETDGSLTHFKAVSGPDITLEEAAIRAIKLSPRWIPGTKNGKTEVMEYNVPINFNIGRDN